MPVEAAAIVGSMIRNARSNANNSNNRNHAIANNRVQPMRVCD